MVYLATGRSPRTRRDQELIGFSHDAATLRGRAVSRGREFVTEVTLSRAARRKITINGVAHKTAAALSEVLAAVYFSPDDLQLIRAGASARRRFLDAAIAQLRPRYAQALLEYGRLYDHKNRILKDAQEKPSLLSVLPEFNEGLVRWGAVLVSQRAKFCLRLEELAAVIHGECSGGRESLSLRYETVSTVTDPLLPAEVLREQLALHMREHQAAELASRQCLSGPHKDDLLVLLDGRPARQFGSQGQTRTAALALKLAEREVFTAALGEHPLLLLDDVLSELDARRQEYVLNRISGGQLFISCCQEEAAGRLLSGQVLRIQDGKVSAL
jgi:DNA replication and repair protein RecF